jgi:chemotaxis protein CheD
MTGHRGAVRGRAGPFQDAGCTLVPVGIGDVKVAAGASVLFSIGIGSCVAVAVYDSATKTGGMAHVMLPKPPRRQADGAAFATGRFAATAIPRLVEMMSEQGVARDSVRARIAGGASMFRDLLDGDGLRLGRRNVEAVRNALQQAGIPIDGEDVLGAHGRSVYLRTTDGALLVTSVNRDDIRL